MACRIFFIITMLIYLTFLATSVGMKFLSRFVFFFNVTRVLKMKEQLLAKIHMHFSFRTKNPAPKFQSQLGVIKNCKVFKVSRREYYTKCSGL